MPGISASEEADRNVIVEESTVLPNGDTATRRYNRGRLLTKLGFVRVYEMMDLETNQLMAVKVIPKESLRKSRDRQKLMSEIKIHQSLHHPYVVGFDHYFEDSENIYIFLEICTNQTMHELLRRRTRLTELEVQYYMTQLIAAVKYLHAHRVIHRDLKLGNLFLSDRMEIKVGEFCLAAKLDFEGERRRTICGTMNFIAPEILEGSGYSYEVDVWYIGIILYTLLVGKSPFESSNVQTAYRNIRLNAFTYFDNVQLSEQAKDLIARLLISEPQLRLTLDEIQAHEFFNQGNRIPKLMPLSTLVCPPLESFLRQYVPDSDPSQTSSRIIETAPSKPLQSSISHSVNTDKLISSMPETEVGVNKWMENDGLGYLLSNGATGVLFNDSTKIMLSASGHLFNYMESCSSDSQEFISSFSFTEYPEELKNKVALLQHFRSCYEGDIPQETCYEEQIESNIYVKEWMRARYAVIFCLSNNAVQVIFQDDSQIIISNKSRMVAYVSKSGELSTYPLSTALESSNPEMSKRLNYTRDFLTHISSAGIEPSRMDDVESPLTDEIVSPQ